MRLETVIGLGGVSVVWRARDLERDVPVAVKLMRADDPPAKHLKETFESEIRAVSALDHPGVARVLGFGRLPADVAGELTAGTPYLVMELAAGDLGDPQRGPADWPAARSVLRQILGALAHAHARGVVHRDLKPANVLAFDDPPGRVAVTDFGIAASTRGSAKLASAGSPEYMAPEQIRGDWRAQGSATDLYSLGCVAWRLLTGASPFARSPYLRHAHLSLPPPRLRPRFPVPDGLEGWLRTLLAKSPHQRFACAADAAWHLARLEEPGTVAPDAVAAFSPVPPRALPRQQALLGGGLGLFGLRRIPLVKRDAEREQLWSALGRVHADRGVEVVVLRGPPGTGKGALARWICELSEETGAAVSLRAPQPEEGGEDAALAAMVVRFARGARLARAGLLRRIRAELRRFGPDPDGLAEAVTDLVRPDADAPRGAERDSVRWNVIRRLLAHLGRRRPVVLWVDDVHRAPRFLRLVNHLLERAEDIRGLLVVLTARDTPLDLSAGTRAVLDELQEQPQVHALSIGPMDRPASTALIRASLDLDAELESRVVERTAGVPLFVVQLVGDWVEGDRLEVVDGRLRPRSGVRLALPDGLHELWMERVDRALRRRSPSDLEALEIAAALGSEVDEDEWLQACRAADIEPDGGLVNALMWAQLVEPGAVASSWRFAHPLLAESLRRHAREQGRASRHHLACHALFRDDLRPDRPYARIARHLLAAGQPEEALSPLRQALLRALVAYREPETTETLALLERTAASVLPPEDPRWGDVITARSGVAWFTGQWDRAREASTELLTSARRYGWYAFEVSGLLQLGDVELASGDLREAWRLGARATQWGADHDDGDAMALGSKLLGLAALGLGSLRDAEEYLDRARAQRAEGPRTLSTALLDIDLAEVARRRGDLPRAHALIRRAEEQLRAGGVGAETHARAAVLMREADVLFSRGKLEEAAAAYVRTAEIEPRPQLRPVAWAAVIDLYQGRIEAAVTRLTQRAFLAANRSSMMRAGVLAACAALRADRAEAANRLEEVAERSERSGLVDPVLADLLERTAAAATKQGFSDLAEQAERLAAHQRLHLASDPPPGYPPEVQRTS